MGEKAFSHSRLEALDGCPRKFELSGKLNIRKRIKSLTFAYGHAFGEGVQALLAGKTFEEMIWEVFRDWEVPLDMAGYEAEQRNKKGFWDCIDTLEKFDYLRNNMDDNELLLNSRKIVWTDWEIAKFVSRNGEVKDAVELELEIDLGNGFFYEGHIDLVLKHKVSERFAVLELKTSGLHTVPQELFGNSPQPTGYMIALDTQLVKSNPDATTSFDVFYLVAQTKKKQFYEFQFTKTPLHRNQWLSYLLAKIDQVENLESRNLPYPINFKSCFSYNRPCEFYGLCHLPNEVIQRGNDMAESFDTELEPADISVTLDEIIERQVELLEKYEEIELIESRSYDLEVEGKFDDLLDNILIDI